MTAALRLSWRHTSRLVDLSSLDIPFEFARYWAATGPRGRFRLYLYL
jgi:hypothetical protein